MKTAKSPRPPRLGRPPGSRNKISSPCESVASPTLVQVRAKQARRYPDREGKIWVVTEADTGKIAQFGVGPRAGEALVRLNRADLHVWIPVENLEIVDHQAAPLSD